MFRKKSRTKTKRPRCEVCKPAKFIYLDEEAIHVALRNSKKYGVAFRIYECPFGNGFHFTRQKKR